MSSRHFRGSTILQCGVSSLHLSFSSRGGRQWLCNPAIEMFVLPLQMEWKALRSGTERWMVHQMLTLFVLVSALLLCPAYCLNTLFVVLDPNVKDLYCRSCWSADEYAAGLERLKEVVCHMF
jgi:hypothetical protein